MRDTIKSAKCGQAVSTSVDTPNYYFLWGARTDAGERGILVNINKNPADSTFKEIAGQYVGTIWVPVKADDTLADGIGEGEFWNGAVENGMGDGL